MRKGDKIKLQCMSPKVAFKEIIDSNPYMIHYTSGSLPSFEETNELTGLKYNVK